MTKKSLCVVTGTRAEYGLLRPVLQKLLQSDVIEPRLVVTGAHLAPEFGNTDCTVTITAYRDGKQIGSVQTELTLHTAYLWPKEVQ